MWQIESENLSFCTTKMYYALEVNENPYLYLYEIKSFEKKKSWKKNWKKQQHFFSMKNL